ncbi:MAG: hypothetical protein ACKPKO_47925, partial [Candidatus Fonsibacter sp.]
MRFYLSKDKDQLIDQSVKKIINEEVDLGLNEVQVLSLIEEKIKNTKQATDIMLKEIGVRPNEVFVGYGAP